MVLNNDGTLLATCSEKGTLIRIFKTDDGAFLQELRRGKEKAEIYSIRFDNGNKFVACTSDRGTVHIWSLLKTNKKLKEAESVNDIKEEEIQELPKNQKSILRAIPKFLVGGTSYFEGEWSFAQLRLDHPKSLCCFGPDNTIIVLTSSGLYYLATYDVHKGGDCSIIQEININKIDKDVSIIV
jgi:WD40 repeat protein